MSDKLPLKKLPLVAAVSVLLSTGAFAETRSQATENNPDPTVTSAGVMDMQENSEAITDIEGTNVVSTNGETIGDIDRIVQSDNKKMAVIGLNLSLKEVAVPLNELSWENDRLVINASKDELENKTDVDMTDFQDLEPGQYGKADFARFEKKMGSESMAADKAESKQ